MLKRRLFDDSSVALQRQKLHHESCLFSSNNQILDRQKLNSEWIKSPDSIAYGLCVHEEDLMVADTYSDTIGELVDEKYIDILICEGSNGTVMGKENRGKNSITDYFVKKETPIKPRVKSLQQAVYNNWSGYRKQTAILEYIQHNTNYMDTVEEIECGDDFCRSCNIKFSCNENYLLRCTFCNKLCCAPSNSTNNSCIKSCDTCNEYYCKYCSTINYDFNYDRLLCLDCNNN